MNLFTRIPKWNRKHFVSVIVRVILYIFLFDMVFIFLYPFLHIVVTSFKTNADLYDSTVNWIPRTLKYQNYLLAFKSLSYFLYLKNTLIYTIFGTVGHMLSCSFIGYGFARYKLPGGNILLVIVLLGIVIPIQTLIVPYYMMYANFNWINTYLPVIVPTYFGFGLRGGLFILIFRQFYLGMPRSLEEAAKIDGCNFLRTYWNIALPVVKSAFIVSLVLSIAWHWNDFFEPITFTNNFMHPLPERLNTFSELVNSPPQELFDQITYAEDSEKIINNAVLMAATMLVISPVIVLFTFLQRKFIQGIERTGLVE